MNLNTVLNAEKQIIDPNEQCNNNHSKVVWEQLIEVRLNCEVLHSWIIAQVTQHNESTYITYIYSVLGFNYWWVQ